MVSFKVGDLVKVVNPPEEWMEFKNREFRILSYDPSDLTIIIKEFPDNYKDYILLEVDAPFATDFEGNIYNLSFFYNELEFIKNPKYRII